MRLQEIYELIPFTNTFADIGCDHGILCRMVCEGKKAKRIFAVDISAKCLDKAKKLLGDKAEYFCGDGLDPLGELTPDVTVISGMGGNTILHILAGRLLPKVIISPQNDVYKVRKTLVDSGYAIVEDKVTSENGKYYDIIVLEPGKSELDEIQLRFGAFYKRGDKLFSERLKKDKEKLLSYKQTPTNIGKLKMIDIAEKSITAKGERK